MRRLVKATRNNILPHEIGERAIALRQEALFAYAFSIFLLQFGLHLVSSKFPGVLGFASNISADAIVSQTNRQRAENGLTELKTSGKLIQAANRKGEYMFSKNFWSHTAPDGTTPWFFIQKADYHYLYAGENLAKDFQDSNDVVAAWMASQEGHRANILNPNYKEIGVAVVNGVLNGFETTLVVQMFAAENVFSETKTELTPDGEKAENRSQNTDVKTPVSQGNKEREAAFSEKAPLPEIKPAGSKTIIPIVDVIALSKSVSYAFGFFLLGLFLLDGIVSVRKNLVRISGHTLAHMMVVVLLLATTWLLSPGTIR